MHSVLHGHASPEFSRQSVASVGIPGGGGEEETQTHLDEKHTAKGGTTRRR